MDIISQLIIAALFSLHQYIPADQNTKYFDYSVDPVTLTADHKGIEIVAAAHSTCRFMFKEMGGEMDLTESKLVAFAFQIIDEKKSDLNAVDVTSEGAKNLIGRICQENFDPQAFTREELGSIEEFIKTHVSVLDKEKVDSTGAFKFFGRVDLYDRNGKLMGPLYTLGDHWIPYSEISPYMPQALIAGEDEHFLKHEGVYLGSLVRMAYNMQRSSGSEKDEKESTKVTGGSTITMQLLKNLYFNTWPDPKDSAFQKKSKLKTLLRKVREWYWAKPYEKYHETLGPGSGKRFVLENYLNLLDYGPGVRGIDQAAEVFFSKKPSELSISDSAFLASLFKGPRIYSRPKNYKDLTQPRKEYVLSQMAGLSADLQGIEPISQEEASKAQAEALPQWKVPVVDDGTPVDSYLRVYAKEFISNEVTLPAGARAIESELVTTIDADLQKVVFDTVRTSLDKIDNGRDSLARVMAARDDRSRVALAEEDDLRAEDMSELLSLQAKFDELQINTEIAIYLGDRGDRSTGSRKQFYILGKDSVEVPQPLPVQADLHKAFSEKAKFVGQILIAEVAPERCDGLQVSEHSYKDLNFILSKYGQIAEEPSFYPDKDVAKSQEEEAVVPFKLADKPSDPNFIPTPESRPENWEELVAQSPAVDEDADQKFLQLPVGRRPAVRVPFADQQSKRCARLISAREMETLKVWETFATTEDYISKRLVNNFISRIEMLAPRENLFPAVIDGRGGSNQALVLSPTHTEEMSNASYDHWVRPIQLQSGHAGYLQTRVANGEWRTGQILWVEPSASNTFSLVSPKAQAAVVAIDSETGDVLANFGGYLPRSSKFFDRSRLAMRPAGSTLKPWLYFLALNKNLDPSSTVKNFNAPFIMPNGKRYDPDNYSGGGGASLSLEKALITSQNKAAVGLLSDPRFGPNPTENLNEFIDLVTSINIYKKGEMEVTPTAVLGTQVLSIVDLVSSFTFFSNGKNIVKPRFFKSLQNGQGQNLFEGKTQTIDVPHSDNAKAVYDIQSMLVRVANAGTAGRLRSFPNELKLPNCEGQVMGSAGQVCFGGKTGTSDNSKDNWFIGFSKKFVIGVWVGYDFPESTGATGGAIALPIFMDIIRDGRQYLPSIEPIVGENTTTVNMKCSCDGKVYSGNDWDYHLNVNGQYVRSFETSDDGSVDRQSCEDALRSVGCPR